MAYIDLTKPVPVVKPPSAPPVIPVAAPPPPANAPVPGPTSPVPVPSPSLLAEAWDGLASLLPHWPMMILIGFLLWLVVYEHKHAGALPIPSISIFHTPLTGTQKLGHDWGVQNNIAAAQGFEAAAAKLQAGSTVEDADAELQKVFHAASQASFATVAGPAFNAIVPAATEPTDPAKRAAFVQLHRDFAAGLRHTGW